MKIHVGKIGAVAAALGGGYIASAAGVGMELCSKNPNKFIPVVARILVGQAVCFSAARIAVGTWLDDPVVDINLPTKAQLARIKVKSSCRDYMNDKTRTCDWMNQLDKILRVIDRMSVGERAEIVGTIMEYGKNDELLYWIHDRREDLYEDIICGGNLDITASVEDVRDMLTNFYRNMKDIRISLQMTGISRKKKQSFRKALKEIYDSDYGTIEELDTLCDKLRDLYDEVEDCVHDYMKKHNPPHLVEE